MQRIWRHVCLVFAVVILVVPFPKIARAGETRPLIFEPVSSPTTRSYFANGQPVAIVTTDSALVMLLMDPADVGGQKYVRVWCLYYSTASDPVLLDPIHMATVVSTNIKKGKSRDVIPESPTKILKQISNEMANREILQGIGGVLASAGQSLAVRPTTIIGGGNAAGMTWIVNDYDTKQRAAGAEVERQTADAMDRTRTAYDLYSRSVSAGILRRNTVFPGGSVNGYIYFPVGELGVNGYTFPDGVRYALALQLPHGEVKVDFNPAAGE